MFFGIIVKCKPFCKSQEVCYHQTMAKDGKGHAAGRKHDEAYGFSDVPNIDQGRLNKRTSRQAANRGDMTTGDITRTMLVFAVPMILGNLLQQCYNIADTLIVGRFLGAGALAAVGSAYTLMVFLTSILLGLSMGSGAVFSIRFGEKNPDRLRNSIFISFILISMVTLALTSFSILCIDGILRLLRVPADIYPVMKEYVRIIFYGIVFTFLYNYFACLLRAVGDSITPLVFLAISTVVNIVLDVVLIVVYHMGVGGAALATVIAQALAGIGIAIHVLFRYPELRVKKRDMKFSKKTLQDIGQSSSLTCIQQSVMNFGILMVQGLVNSFGTVVMAAFAAAVKIDSFAYMPVQDLGNAFSTFVAQNHGAGRSDRIREGIKRISIATFLFCIAVGTLVFLFAEPLTRIFIDAGEVEIISISVQYLRVVAPFYFGIGILFLLYGFYRALLRPGMSLILTLISLGTRVALAYALAAVPTIGVVGIWWAIPIGWVLADCTGIGYYLRNRKRLLNHHA